MRWANAFRLLAHLLLLGVRWVAAQDASQQCQLPQLVEPWGRQQFRIAVLAIRGADVAIKEYQSTAEYLTASVGTKFNPPLSFEIVPVTFGEGDSVVDTFQNGEYDFVVANPSIQSCVALEKGLDNLATLVSKRIVGGRDHRLTRFGGVIFTSANNTNSIQTINDVKDKRVGCVSLNGLGR